MTDRIVHPSLLESGVDHVLHVGNRDRRLGHVRGDHAHSTVKENLIRRKEWEIGERSVKREGERESFYPYIPYLAPFGGGSNTRRCFAGVRSE